MSNFQPNMLGKAQPCADRIFGFLLGFSLASSYAAYHLLDEYQKASAMLQASVEELRLTTEKVGTHMHKLTIELPQLTLVFDSRFPLTSGELRQLRRISKRWVKFRPRKTTSLA